MTSTVCIRSATGSPPWPTAKWSWRDLFPPCLIRGIPGFMHIFTGKGRALLIPLSPSAQEPVARRRRPRRGRMRMAFLNECEAGGFEKQARLDGNPCELRFDWNFYPGGDRRGFRLSDMVFGS